MFFLAGEACSTYTGILLDEAGTEIPETELIGKTQCAAGSELSSGLIELSGATVFSGIRLSGPFNTDAGWQWNWNPDDRPVVGEIQASGNQPPIPDAGGPYVGEAGMPVTFDASASIDDGTITTYIWDFGDGTTLGGETVQHTYASGDKWNVTLTVTDDMDTSKSTHTIADIGDASLRPTAHAGGPYTGETLVNVAFSGVDSNDSDGTVDQYEWDFGDGTPKVLGTATPLHPYDEAGTYYVVLTVMDNTGETDKTVTKATITTGTQEAPVADAGPPAEGTVGTAVSFDGSDSSGTIAQYDWDWDYGDLTTDINAGPTPSHTYAAAGDYTVLLTVIDGDGVKDTGETAASIDANPLPPTADGRRR